MRSYIPNIIAILFTITAMAQSPQAEIEGNVTIDGRLEISQGTSVLVGRNAGPNQTGLYATYLGDGAGQSNTSGSSNTFIGRGAGTFNQTGNQNTFVGAVAGARVTDGKHDNTFIGYGSGNEANGIQNTLVGSHSGADLVGSFNVGIGYNTLTAGNSVEYVTAVGIEAGKINESHANTFLGAFSGTANTTGSQNTFLGTSTGLTNQLGSSNTFVGYTAGFANASGNGNSFFGMDAGRSITSGSNNICIGLNAGPTFNTSNQLYIDVEKTDQPLILGDFSADVIKIHGTLATEKDQAILRMTTLNHVSGSVLVLKNNTISHTDVGAINFENPSGQTKGQIAYKLANEMSFRVNDVNPLMKLSTSTDHIIMSNGAKLTSGGVWTNSCSAALKNLMAQVKGPEILEKLSSMSIYDWNYKTNPEESHVGPTAEEFYELFALGNSDKNISGVDLAGVALAAVQELVKINKRLASENKQLELRLQKIEAKIFHQ